MSGSLPPLSAAPSIGIFMTAYNHAAFVAEAVESVLDQGIPANRLQFLIVNDGSTDATREALAPYERHVRIIHQPNGGLRAAVNRGMGELDADVITAISGDDAWPAGRVGALLEALAENPAAGLVYSDMEVMAADGSTIHPSFMELYGLTPYTGRIAGPLLRGNFISGVGCMLRGSLKPLVHPIPQMAAWEDWWWAWRISVVAGVAYLPQSTCRYRQHDGNISLGAGGGRLVSAWREELRFRRWLLGEVPPAAAAGRDLLLGLFAFFGLVNAIQREDTSATPAVTVSDADREVAADRRGQSAIALTEGDLDGATRHIVAALAADPFDDMCMAFANKLGGRFPEEPEPAVQCRSFMTIADAGELRDHPEMLEEVAERFGRDDDATLVIYGRGWDAGQLGRTFGPLAAGFELDILAVTDPPVSRRQLLDRADAVFGERLDLAGSSVPRYGSGETEALRRHAEQAWEGRSARAA